MGNQAFRVRKEAPFRADIVGSFLRPEALKQAREAHASGAITQQELTAVEDAHIRDLVQKQKEAGLQCITDGEFRRSYWHLDFSGAFRELRMPMRQTATSFMERKPAMIPHAFAVKSDIKGIRFWIILHL